MCIAFVLSRKLTKFDYKRFGINKFKKKKVFVYDFSNLLNHRSVFFQQTNISINNYKIIKSYKELILEVKKNNIKYAVDFLENSFSDFIIRLILIKYNIKLIKFLVGLKPNIIYPKKNFKNYYLGNLKDKIIKYVKGKFIKKIISKIYWIILITGKNFQNYENLIHDKIKKVYTHSLDYDNYLLLKKKKVAKKYVIFIDQNIPYHQDLYIKKRKSIVTAKNYYSQLFKFLKFIEKSYRTKVIIAGHPKKGMKNPYLEKCKFKVEYNKTPELIQMSKFIIMHFSTAVSYCVLFKKPIIFVTNNELNNKRVGHQISTLREILGADAINISNKFKKLSLKTNLRKYERFKDNYLKYPNSKDMNSWQLLEKFLLKKY
tara:strand:+ start:1123 stop:2241 length:1119 start_codon:yes stop_codon:yes gene_type:complete